MIASTLPDIEIPDSSANEFGVTVNVGHFDYLTVEVPPLPFTFPFGSNIITVSVDGRSVAVCTVEANNPTRLSIKIPPVAVRCCWQDFKYEVETEWGAKETSNILYVLNEHVHSN
ncbi:hypothetical protein [Pseudomonas orientalis]|uniref:hypothetical protein n=1 Tax=Pseudomonas orientalis TaxID=76758 RepID=UPI000F5635A7|nr:hypothetical protein [Pseudomonas orientalis]AZE90866.1 hypothetical protein C4J97_4193 [Pseudomonas orientalis]